MKIVNHWEVFKMKRVVVNPRFLPQEKSTFLEGGVELGASCKSSKQDNVKMQNEHLHSSSPKSGHNKENGDFYFCVRSLLRLGRLLGIVPISGLFFICNRESVPKYKWFSIATFSSALVIAALAVNVVINFVGFFLLFNGGNAAEIASKARVPLFYLTVLIVYIFFLCKSTKLVDLFWRWRKVTEELKLQVTDRKLSMHIAIYTFVIYFSAIIYIISIQLVQGIGLTDVEISQENTNSSNNETETETLPAELYYKKQNPFWALFFDYHPFLNVFLAICGIINLFAWNYADLIIIAFSRALYFKFKALAQETEKRIVTVSQYPVSHKLTEVTWTEVRRDHLILCKLLDEFESFLSPLIFFSYSINTFFICLQIHDGLTPNNDENRTVMDILNSAWAFFQLILRTMAISITGAKVHENAHKISVSIQKCSSTDYCKEAERLERMLGTTTLGLSGFGFFIVTRAFLLVVISVVFTMEIVFLQATAASLMDKGTSK